MISKYYIIILGSVIAFTGIAIILSTLLQEQSEEPITQQQPQLTQETKRDKVELIPANFSSTKITITDNDFMFIDREDLSWILSSNQAVQVSIEKIKIILDSEHKFDQNMQMKKSYLMIGTNYNGTINTENLDLTDLTKSISEDEKTVIYEYTYESLTMPTSIYGEHSYSTFRFMPVFYKNIPIPINIDFKVTLLLKDLDGAKSYYIINDKAKIHSADSLNYELHEKILRKLDEAKP